MELVCQRCKHEWNYTGKNEYYVTCPTCKTSVKVRKEVKQ